MSELIFAHGNCHPRVLRLSLQTMTLLRKPQTPEKRNGPIQGGDGYPNTAPTE